jgi:hypothetical protein
MVVKCWHEMGRINYCMKETKFEGSIRCLCRRNRFSSNHFWPSLLEIASKSSNYLRKAQASVCGKRADH